MKVTLKEVEVEVGLSIGASLDEAIELVGAEKVYELYKGEAERVGAKVVKRYMRKGFDAERIESAMKDWTPAEEKRKIVDKVGKVAAAFEKLSETEKEAIRIMLV